MLPLRRRAATGLSFASVLAVAACAAAGASESPVIPDGKGETVVYVIRHAEKASETATDPDLSERGSQRAESLAVQLRDSGVNMIITSHLRRTQQTAEPLAKARNIRPMVIPIEPTIDAHINRIITTVKRHQGATILIVGHNNTVGKIVERLGAGRIGDLCVDEYSNLIILALAKNQLTRLLLENYGLPDPPAQPGCPHLKDR
jgi:2,3-bisphosphoglycerate-dependent phosphoglycerate mutase